MQYFRLFVLLFLYSLIMPACKTGKNSLFILSAPAGNLYTSIKKNGITVLPNGRLLTPAGKSLVVATHPFGLALSRDGKIAITANSGVSPLSISIIRNLTTTPEISQVPPGYSTNTGVLESVFMGLAISPDNSKVYVAAGQENKILAFDLHAKKNYVSRVHYSFGSIFKTFWNILGLPYLNQYDAGATDLSDMFTGTPDLTPYKALAPDIRIFDPQKALSPLDEKFDWNSLGKSPILDDPREMVKDQKEKAEFRMGDQKKK